MNGEMEMRREEFGNGFHKTLTTSAVILMLVSAAWAASKEKVLYTLTVAEGINPAASLVFDANGALYGTATGGGQGTCGTVFAVSPTGNGGWTESTLHSFACGPSDGKAPHSALVFDQVGNLYGTTANGGSRDCGIVFELTPLSGGGWTESVLHDFGGGGNGQTDGCNPYSNLVFDAAGNLYGTTSTGGGGITEGSCNHGCGAVFKLSAAKGGGWTESVIHSFRGRNNDGENPFAGLVMDKAGNLYGTTFSGGTVFGGAVFRLTLNHGNWKETVLYNFQGGDDGANPYAGLVFDLAGALYGTTVNGGRSQVGTVFKLAPASGGKWKESVLHSFGFGKDGFYPFGGVILDAAGNPYGTTEFGGALKQGQKGAGTVFKLVPKSGGGWKEKILFNFSSRERANQMQRNPFGGLVSDANGNFFGTAQPLEGILLGGVVFEVTP
jgi:uncharacterized repeat protein (TIGR03803 family)